MEKTVLFWSHSQFSISGLHGATLNVGLENGVEGTNWLYFIKHED